MVPSLKSSVFWRKKYVATNFFRQPGNCPMSVPSATDRPLCSLCECPIRQEARSATLQCKHIYHKNCLDNWLVKFNCCPQDGISITSINDQPYITRNCKRALLLPTIPGNPKRLLSPLSDSVRPIKTPCSHSQNSVERAAAKAKLLAAFLAEKAEEAELLSYSSDTEESSGDETDENMPPLVEIPFSKDSHRITTSLRSDTPSSDPSSVSRRDSPC